MNQSTEILTALVALAATALFFRTLLSKLGQTWIRTFPQTATLLLLPIITFIITKVISGNIALSLGMVGALSIVRFRNPVKSPFELAVYFASITMGIAASISLKWLLVFILALVMCAGILSLCAWGSKRFLKRDYFIASFGEGVKVSTLHIKTREKIDNIEKNEFLISKVFDSEYYTYILAAQNFEALRDLSEQLEKYKSINSVNLIR